MSDLRFALLGTGFWSHYQLAGWQELTGAKCVAIYGRNKEKAQAIADKFGVPAAYDDADLMMRDVKPDFIDIVTNVETHCQFVELAAEYKTPVICQKPMAVSLAEAERMVSVCKSAGVPLYIHENWRWQEPLRAFKAAYDKADIGKVFRARIDMITGFPVFVNQPFFKDLEQFLLTDIGSHILDVARWLFGEVDTVYCHTQTVHADIKGEDVASVMLRTKSGATVVCNMAYAENYLEKDRFPETYVFAEASHGSIELGPDYWVRVTTKDGTVSHRHVPHHYPWADPAYDVAQGAIVPCCANILSELRGEGKAETTGDDNLQTVKLVFGAYESQATGQVVRMA